MTRWTTGVNVPRLTLAMQAGTDLPTPITVRLWLRVRYRIFSRKLLEYGTVSVALYTTDTEPYL